MTTFTSEKPRLLILDCNRFELATLADSLRMQGVDVVGEASDMQSAHELFRALAPETILMNFQGCDKSCVQLLNACKE